jgi:hypothetical protein
LASATVFVSFKADLVAVTKEVPKSEKVHKQQLHWRGKNRRPHWRDF